MSSRNHNHTHGRIDNRTDNRIVKYNAAIFDMDGLLLDTEKIINQCLKDTASVYGLEDMDAVFINMIGLRIERSREVLRNGLPERVDFESFYETAVHKAQEALRLPVPVKADVEKLLLRLESCAIPCVVASSTKTELVQRQLSDAGLIDFFKTITGGDQVVKAKPDPEIYHKAARSLGLDAATCVAFEDSNHGATAAIASGATTVQVPDMVPVQVLPTKQQPTVANTVWEGAKAVGLVS